MTQRDEAISPRDAATKIAGILSNAGFTAYFAGGCVRDRILNLEPGDYDIATNAHPDEVAKLFRGSRGVGTNFGVMLVRMGGHTIEVATFRSDGPYQDGRRPESVTFSTDQLDAHRRDFTINGIFEDPATGKIIDYVEGKRDIASGVVRAIGSASERIAEDRLRTLRAVRFAARLNFSIDPATEQAIRDAAPGLNAVSRERIGNEVRHMLSHPSRTRACALLQTTHLDGSTLIEESIDAELSTLQALDPSADWVTALVAWRLDRSRATPSLRGDARAALMLSNDEHAALVSIELAITQLPTWTTLPLAAQIRAAARPGFTEALAVALARNPTARCQLDHYRSLCARPGGIFPAPFITGQDLIDRKMNPGPSFKKWLDRAYDAQLTGPMTTRDEAVMWLESALSHPDGN
ncbi:MAG: CCA tRNA nucleotidyltransferase [Planctomycetota bacterium]|nr:CCA tRNA nucleotidyltransferase [Planctomycetota bacterium]